ncbi:MAG: SRPBCC family protein [Chloroflexi bacterium]|nr:SRPBCC family protein [Chloroflexota bacterium]
MPCIDRHIRIDAPPDVVWSVLIDLPRQPSWMRDLRDLRIETPGPLRVGGRATAVVRVFGLSQPDPIEVVALDAGSRYAIRHLGPVAGTGEFRLWPMDDGRATHVRWREDLHVTVHAVPVLPRLFRVRVVGRPARLAARILARIADPLLVVPLTIVFRSDLRNLRETVEASVGDQGADRGARDAP